MTDADFAEALRPGAVGGALLVQVAVEAAVDRLYTYQAPWPLSRDIRVGQAVLAPLRSRQASGYVMAVREAAGPLPAGLKPISEILRPEPLFGPGLSRLVHFLSQYYFYPPGLCLREILPGGLSPATETTVHLAAEARGGQALIGAEAELSARLRAAGQAGLPLRELEAEGLAPLVKKLGASGRLRLASRLADKGPRPAFEWWLGPAPEIPEVPPRLGPQERRLWALVQGGPPKPLSYYAAYLKNPLARARSLAAKGLALLSRREIYRDDPRRAIFEGRAQAPPPTPEQAAALAAVGQALEARSHHAFLLFGVTGSGKTEVYLRAAEKALAQGREVLWLAPEIGLAMSLEGLLKSRFSAGQVAVLHSGLTPGQRHDQWLRIRRGLAPVVLGARSAVFAPLENLGLVVVDEEHDWAYKQDDGLRYNGRDLARRRAAEAGAALILGSATPSFESYQAALDGRLTLLKMSRRPGQAFLPRVELLDQGAEPARQRRALSQALARRLGETLDRGEQALLFINRRGLASLPICLKCGEVLKCPHCSRTLTLHGPETDGPELEQVEIKGQETLICHSCGYRAAPPRVCPACRSQLFRYLGLGTEKLLKMARDLFPRARGARLDADAARRRGGLKSILKKFSENEYNLLVGTQMAAKGHDFPNLTLVGVVDADLGLNLPDFRAAERTFQLLSQVSGRAGRAGAPGAVLIQTLTPRHPVLAAVARHDYEAFFEQEIETRRLLGYPPFGRLALIRLSGPDEGEVGRQAEKMAGLGRPYLPEFGDQLELLGPAPAPQAKLKDRYRCQFLLRASAVAPRHRFLSLWLPAIRKALPAGLRLTVDIDPYHFL
ncbi:MAG: primosomal protein N' [Candidatus Adiutrix sp.]|jgi:primosomal protein N' (replication factor Y)|nr:primosomal protein N' [Candidatus Adiutrix sp.]